MEQIIDADLAQAIYDGLVEDGYVRKGKLKDKFYEDKKDNAVVIAPEAADSAEGILTILDSIYDSRSMQPEDARKNNVELHLDKAKLGLPEFRKLWDKINIRPARMWLILIRRS